MDLPTARNPLLDDEINPANHKKSTGQKSASSSSSPSFTGVATVIGSSFPEKNDELNAKNDGYEGVKDSVIAEHLTGILSNSLCFDDVSNEWYQQHNWLWQPVSKKLATKTIGRALSTVLPHGYSMSKLNSIEAFLTMIRHFRQVVLF